MDLLQVASILGSVVLLVGLLGAHRLVVRHHLLPAVEGPLDEDETEDGRSS